MLTVNQRDLLAVAITDRLIVPGDPIERWIKEFEWVRKQIEEIDSDDNS
jgi:hypothetical protein